MKALYFSFIIPVFNRPDEIKELLESFSNLEGGLKFEIVIVEDGSELTSKTIIENFKKHLDISYYFKENSGPGDSRNFGMKQAKGNYFIILDSDCILPKDYLKVVNNNLIADYVDCFGGPDAAHQSFTHLQKAINFSMTSFITTGGIRGGNNNTNKFQPRSFNMGISKTVFEATGGFGLIHPGEDPDLSIRLNTLGFTTQFFKDAFVYHKRRISWSKFYNQVYKFGMVRPILNSWHPHTERIVYWFPSLFCIGFIVSLIFFILGNASLLFVYGLYFAIAFLVAIIKTQNITISILSMIAICIQFLGYGFGFLKSTFAIKVLGNNPEKKFPNLFYKHVN
jgi:glycosyltransferase involved in cell wall biosynthesis